VIGASGSCDANGQTSTVLVTLSAPILTAGSFQLILAPGSDGNTLIDQCGLQVPGSSLSFTTKDTVSATFNDAILYGCKVDTIAFGYTGRDGVNQWSWVFDGTDTSVLQNPPERIYPVFGPKTAQLVVSNGFCSDTARVDILLGNAIHAQFETQAILCPKDYASFQDSSTGNISSWNWDFGDNTGSSLQSPLEHLFPPTGIEEKYTILLIVGNSLGCYDTAAQVIDVLRSCYIAVPSAFTPNGDGLNDYLYPLNAFKADNLTFRVYNRYGQMVFQTNDWTKKWDGTINGHPEPPGTFVWTLQYTDHDSGKQFFLKGTSILIR
jgi:gliding motility-associated-like protein